MKKNILITGCAGFIGFHLTIKLLKNNNRILGIDKISNYYSTKLKYDRLRILKSYKNFNFIKSDLASPIFFKSVNKFNYNFDYIIHLAAQAGVRYSLSAPNKYIKDNIVAHTNICEFAKLKKINKVIYASSSSVYGKRNEKQYSENLILNDPLSLYSATKQSVEQISKFYSNYYKIKFIGLRIFTSYGPYGRPDLSVFQLTKDLIEKKEVRLLNYGKTSRDFTYVDDTVDMIVSLMKFLKSKKNNKYHEIFNLGTGKSISTLKLAKIIAKILKIKFTIKFEKHHKSDMTHTRANTQKIKKLLRYEAKISPEIGVSRFVEWFKNYY